MTSHSRDFYQTRDFCSLLLAATSRSYRPISPCH